MGISEYLVFIALIVSFGTVWNWYRVAKLKQKVAVAEKYTEVQNIYIEVLMEAKGLFRDVRSALDSPVTDSDFPIEIKQISQELGQIIQAIASRIEWLQSQNIEDPVVLDEYKFYAHQVRLELKKISSMIKSIEAVPGEKKD